jgi:hypothetical protein
LKLQVFTWYHDNNFFSNRNPRIRHQQNHHYQHLYPQLTLIFHIRSEEYTFLHLIYLILLTFISKFIKLDETDELNETVLPNPKTDPDNDPVNPDAAIILPLELNDNQRATPQAHSLALVGVHSLHAQIQALYRLDKPNLNHHPC